jgi:hypothetical protein
MAAPIVIAVRALICISRVFRTLRDEVLFPLINARGLAALGREVGRLWRGKGLFTQNSLQNCRPGGLTTLARVEIGRASRQSMC